MSTRRNHSHSTEFKIRVVQSYLAGEGTLKGLARQHGIYHSLLRLWVDKYQRGYFEEREILVEKDDEYEAKIASLERKVGQLTMEVDFLKKTSAGGAAGKRHAVDHLRGRGISVSEGCRAMTLPRSTFYKKAQRRPRRTKPITSGRGDKVRKPACPPNGVHSISGSRQARNELAGRKDPRSLDPLIRSLRNRDRQVRRAAATVLVNIRDPRAVEGLAVMAGGWGLRDRWVATAVLLEIDQRIFPDLLTAVFRVMARPASLAYLLCIAAIPILAVYGPGWTRGKRRRRVKSSPTSGLPIGRSFRFDNHSCTIS